MRFNVKVKNERATGSRCIPDSNRQACTATCFSTSEVTPAYGIFHCLSLTGEVFLFKNQGIKSDEW